VADSNPRPAGTPCDARGSRSCGQDRHHRPVSGPEKNDFDPGPSAKITVLSTGTRPSPLRARRGRTRPPDDRSEWGLRPGFGIDSDLVLYLFGTAGAGDRFEFMWEVARRKAMLGYVLLLDHSRPESVSEAKTILGLPSARWLRWPFGGSAVNRQ